MTSFVKRFWQWIVALAVVGGLYLAAFAVKKLRAFWAIVGLAAVLAAGAEMLDSDELWEKAKRDVQMRGEAFRAAHDRAAGRSREEVRDIYVAELRSRGLAMPSDSALDAAVESIMGNPLPSARLMGEGLIETGKLLHGIFKIFWHATGR